MRSENPDVRGVGEAGAIGFQVKHCSSRDMESVRFQGSCDSVRGYFDFGLSLKQGKSDTRDVNGARSAGSSLTPAASGSQGGVHTL